MLRLVKIIIISLYHTIYHTCIFHHSVNRQTLFNDYVLIAVLYKSRVCFPKYLVMDFSLFIVTTHIACIFLSST